MPLTAAESGSGESFEATFTRLYPGLVRAAFKVLGNAEEAEDVAQDVLISLHRRTGRPIQRPDAWCYRAAVHTALNRKRSEGRRQRREEADARSGGGPPLGENPEDEFLRREERERVSRALMRLGPKSATVLVLRMSGFSYAEVADVLGVRVGQIGSLLRRAEAALRKELDHETPR